MLYKINHMLATTKNIYITIVFILKQKSLATHHRYLYSLYTKQKRNDTQLPLVSFYEKYTKVRRMWYRCETMGQSN